MQKKVDLKSCEFALLIQIEDQVHQVLCTKEQIMGFIEELPVFQVLSTPIEGITLGVEEPKFNNQTIDRKDIN